MNGLFWEGDCNGLDKSPQISGGLLKYSGGLHHEMSLPPLHRSPHLSPGSLKRLDHSARHGPQYPHDKHVKQRRL